MAAADASAEANFRGSFLARQALQHSRTSVGRSRFPPAIRLYWMDSTNRLGATTWRARIFTKYSWSTSPCWRSNSTALGAVSFLGFMVRENGNGCWGRIHALALWQGKLEI